MKKLLVLIALVVAGIAGAAEPIHQTIRDQRGNAVAQASVYVYRAGTTTLATLYVSRTSATTVGNPTSTDTYGSLTAYVDDGYYDLKVIRSDIGTKWIYNVAAGRAADRWITPEDYGAVGDGVTDDKADIQSAVTAAVTSGVRRVKLAPKRYLVGSTVVVDHDSSLVDFVLDMTGATLIASTTSPILQIGDGTNAASNVTIIGGTLCRSEEVDAADVIGTAIYMGAAYRCRILDTSIRGFLYGIIIQPYSGKGFVYNTISPKSIIDCKAPIYIAATNSAWANDNHFYDTSIYYGTKFASTDLSSYSAIYMSGAESSGLPVENNAFVGLSIENGSGAADGYLPDAIKGTFFDCVFVGVRVEGFDGAGGTLDPYNIAAASEGNQFIHGTGLDYRFFAEPKVATAQFQRKRNFLRGEWGAHAAGGPVLELYSRGNYDYQPLMTVIEATTDTSFMVLPTGVYVRPNSTAPDTAGHRGLLWFDNVNSEWMGYEGTEGWRELIWDGNTALPDTSWDDFVVPATAVRVPASSAPGTETWLTDTQVLAFDAAGGEYVYFAIQLPHGYMPGSDILFHVHFTTPDQIADSGTVIWKITYTKSAINGTFGATTPVSSTYTNSTGGNVAANKHLMSTSATISGSGMTLSSVIYARLERDPADSHTADAYFLSADAHIAVNRLGTAHEYSD